jgi:hypothetical protein
MAGADGGIQAGCLAADEHLKDERGAMKTNIKLRLIGLSRTIALFGLPEACADRNWV